jgi:CheY-like chemotaxis protein
MSARSPLSFAQRRALVVDARPATRRLCRETLEGAGFITTETDSGVAALTSARLQPPDIVLLGRQLCDASGREVMAWLRSNPASTTTPIVLLGTRAEDAARLNMPAVAGVGDAVSPGAIRLAVGALLSGACG